MTISPSFIYELLAGSEQNLKLALKHKNGFFYYKKR